MSVGAGLDKVQIHQPILIVVDPPHAGAHGFQVVLLVGLRGVLHEGDSRGFANVGEANGNGGVCGFVGCCATGRGTDEKWHQPGSDAAPAFLPRDSVMYSESPIRQSQRQLQQLLPAGHRHRLIPAEGMSGACSSTCSIRFTSRAPLALLFLKRFRTSLLWRSVLSGSRRCPASNSCRATPEANPLRVRAGRRPRVIALHGGNDTQPPKNFP